MRGFTLIEIMVVIVILGVLAALVVPRVLDRPDEARAVAARSDIATIIQALKLYRLDNQRYPTTEQGLNALVAKPEQPPLPPNWKPGGYLERLPKDPWGRPYQYLSPGLKGEIDVFSFGADGQPGGNGFDADVGSWRDAQQQRRPFELRRREQGLARGQRDYGTTRAGWRCAGTGRLRGEGCRHGRAEGADRGRERSAPAR